MSADLTDNRKRRALGRICGAAATERAGGEARGARTQAERLVSERRERTREAECDPAVLSS